MANNMLHDISKERCANVSRYLSSLQCKTLKWDILTEWVYFYRTKQYFAVCSTILLNPLITDFNICAIRNRQDKAKTSKESGIT